jgi:hypothetical protein
MKTLDDAVVELNGVFDGSLPEVEFNPDYDFWVTTTMDGKATLHAVAAGFSVTKEQFQQRAKELGFVGKYRWGVEYKTNGKKPDLDGDIVVKYKTLRNGSNEAIVDSLVWSIIESFKITDQRYKPTDTSYLDKPDSSIDSDTDWYDYENQKALRLPPVGDKSVSYRASDSVWIGCEIAAHYNNGAIVAHNDGFTLVYKQDLRPNNFHARKAEAEKKRVVDAVWEVYHELGDLSVRATFDAMYDLGYLRSPANKD